MHEIYSLEEHPLFCLIIGEQKTSGRWVLLNMLVKGILFLTLVNRCLLDGFNNVSMNLVFEGHF